MIEVYMDDSQVLNVHPNGTDFHLKVPLKNMDSKPHIVSINWSSEFGPTAVNNFRLLASPNAVRAVNLEKKK